MEVKDIESAGEGMVTDGPHLWLIERLDGKELRVRQNRQTARFDATYNYHNRDLYHVEPVSACALLWWNPRVKATEWEAYES